jgi:protein TonB
MLEQLERQETREQLAVPQLEIAPPLPVVENDQRQRRRMVIALLMLLVALSLVLVKDRDFWFPAAEVADSEEVDDSGPAAPLADASTATPGTAAVPVARTARKRIHPAPPPASKSVIPEAAASTFVPASRAALPPLRVEVVAGNRPQSMAPGSPSVAVELRNGASGRASSQPMAGTETASASVPVTNAGERVQMSGDPNQTLSHSVRPEYPLLARQMKVQGRVELDAQIGKDGGVQALQVVGGPAILADAAREAVKQWRFKPYLQNGQPVETQVPITVNFTIQTK